MPRERGARPPVLRTIRPPYSFIRIVGIIRRPR